MNNKNFTYSERVKLEYHLNSGSDCSASKLAKLLGKARSTIYYELKHYTIFTASTSEKFNGTSDRNFICEIWKHFPFTCNGCAKTKCGHRSRIYRAFDAHSKATRLLKSARTDTKHRQEVIQILNRSVCPLINNGQSIAVARQSVNNCDLSESTIRRYIDSGLVNSKRIDLPRAVKFRAKKEYNYKVKPLDVNVVYRRTYDDYKLYMDAYPDSRVVQLDSVIGKSNDSKAILTVFFKNSKLQIGINYNRKCSNIVQIMRKLYQIGKDNGVTLFDVVLADNGTEFKKLHELEKDEEGNETCKVFFCDPYRFCQKAECEKNHGFFRRIWPKGRSMASLQQEDTDEIFSHINNYPRASLNNKSPYELFALEYKPIILFLLNIRKIKKKDIKLIDFKKWNNKK